MTESGAMRVEIFKSIFSKHVRALSHKELFEHCTGGRSSVTKNEFDKTTKKLLMIHNVMEIRCDGQ